MKPEELLLKIDKLLDTKIDKLENRITSNLNDNFVRKTELKEVTALCYTTNIEPLKISVSRNKWILSTGILIGGFLVRYVVPSIVKVIGG